MRGSIRMIVGILVVMGSAGGLDNATDSQLIPVLLLSATGLFLMYSGVNAMKGN